MVGTKKILYATDFSKASERALEEAVRLAKQNNAEILVAHVIEPAPYVAGEEFASGEIYAKLEEVSKREAQASLAKVMQRLKKSKVRAQSLLLKGSAHDQIVKAAKAKKAGMIVIGTHGRTGLAKFFMGSVAGKVVSSASCPVVTVRGK
jgi:nucleotide-binding universal stress UspA family protein